MENAGLKVTVEVSRADGSTAQVLMLDQRGLTYVQLLELQQKAVTPCAQALFDIMARWGNEAAKKASDAPAASPTA
jgi:hypothetical protein